MLDKVSDFFIEQWFAIFLFLISVYIAYWFWKNPIDTDVRNWKMHWDGNTVYKIGENYKGWTATKQNLDDVYNNEGNPLVLYATKRNNPGIKNVPDKMDELKKLNYEER